MAKRKTKSNVSTKGGLSNLASLLSEEDQKAVAHANAETAAVERQAAIEVRKGKYFHNPYNFVPTLPRDPKKLQGNPLGDFRPVSHSAYLSNYWSGRIRVQLTTQTPLLIPDAAQLTELDDEHKVYPLRRVNNQPYLSPTAIKGMLRSAYETITNSRLAIFQNHGDRLAYRAEAKPGIQAGRIAKNADGKLVFHLMEAVKLRRYEAYKDYQTAPYDKGESKVATRYSSGKLPQHQDEVWVKVVRSDKGAAKVAAIELRKSANPPESSGWKAGWACITGPNCNEKKFERVFIEKRQPPVLLTQDDIDFWTRLITDYKQQHEKELDKRYQDYAKGRFDRGLWKTFLQANPTNNERYLFLRAYLGHEPGKTAWSRHVYEEGSEVLKEGTLCYADTTTAKNNIKIQSLIPVTISRKLFKLSPEVLLPKELKPATALSELSPAERVFGWVNQGSAKSHEANAHKGQLRVHSVTCKTKNPTTKFRDNGLVLTILGEPKPTQARFYTADNKKGDKSLTGKPKSAGYKTTQQALRGRKVYPHHQLANPAETPDYWNPYKNNHISLETPNSKLVREYVQPGQQRTSQNRSIKEWVNPQVTFELEIEVTNLSAAELGALIWLLNLPKDHYHRLGGGKSLGFGSVTLSITSADCREGNDWQTQYSSLLSRTAAEATDIQSFIEYHQQKFEDALKSAYPSDKSNLLSAFLQAAKGFDDELPIHYPRINKVPKPDEESFKWFTENDRDSSKQGSGGHKLAIPLLQEDHGLPYKPAKPKAPAPKKK